MYTWNLIREKFSRFYKIMENTSLQLQAQYSGGTVNETDTVFAGQGDQDFTTFRAGTGLFVKF